MSTEKSALATDNGQTPEHDLGMAVYLREWLEYKRVDGAELADAIGCSRSYVSKWVTKERALTNVNWINKICVFLDITDKQLSKMPPKSGGKLVVPSGVLSDSQQSAELAETVEGVEMIEKRMLLHEEADDLPDGMLDLALNMIRRLKGLKGSKTSRPTKRAGTKP